MSDIEHDDGDAPVDRIDQMQSEAVEPKWPIYLGSVALLGFVGAFLYIQFSDGTGPSNLSLIPDATETPTERPTGRDLFGDVDFTVDEPVQEPTTAPFEDPRIADLAQQVADLEALLASQQSVAEPARQVADTSALEGQLADLLSSQSNLEGQLRAMEMRLQAQANRSGAPAPQLAPAPTTDTAALEEEQRRREELEAARQAEAERLATASVIYSGGSQASTSGDSADGSASDFLTTSNNASVETSYADTLSSPSRIVPQGTMIAAVLETAIYSDLPGLIRGRVTYDVWSYDGREILIPRGSTLIGEYDSDIHLGASRVQVAWNRIITTDNRSIMIGSRGTDGLGRAGLTGDVDHNFALKFEAAFFVSVLTRIAGSASSDEDMAAGVDTLNDAGTNGLDEYLSIPPTISVHQGTQINVFVARDLFF